MPMFAHSGFLRVPKCLHYQKVRRVGITSYLPWQISYVRMLPMQASALFLFFILECIIHAAYVSLCISHKWLHGL